VEASTANTPTTTLKTMPRRYAPIVRDNFKHYQPNGSFSQGELISRGYLPPLNRQPSTEAPGNTPNPPQYLPFPQEPIEASGSTPRPLPGPSQQTDVPDDPPQPLTLQIKYPSLGSEEMEDDT
ncbi:hypothetical protein FRC11_005369, partial [Ceratobasidium sp. 423]